MTSVEDLRLLRVCEVVAYEKGKSLCWTARRLSFHKVVRIFQSFWAGLFGRPLPTPYVIDPESGVVGQQRGTGSD
jgi:hypothetical protein